MSSVSYAAGKCSGIFAPPERVYKLADVIDAKKLKGQKFSVNSRNELVDEAYGQIIGMLDIKTVKNLYEWQDFDFHEVWLQNGGISTRDMKDILKEAPQAAGRGFYVSTDPFDSASYGPALTIFQTDGPLLVIDASSTIRASSPEFMTRLQNAGIDAVQMDNGTWLSMISTKHLKIASDTLQDPVWSSGHMLDSVTYYFDRLKAVNFFKQLPDGTPYDIFKKIQLRRIISNNDIRNFLNTFSQENYRLHADTALGRAVGDKAFSYYLEEAGDQGSKAALSQYFGVFKYKQKEGLAFLNKALEKETPLQKKYGAIANYFDLKTMALLSQGRLIKDISSLEFVKKQTEEYENRRKKIKIEKINSFDDFIQSAQILLGKIPKFRRFDVVMTPELAVDDSFTIKMSENQFAVIEHNLLLTVQTKRIDPNSGIKEAMVSYTSLKKLIEHADNLPVSDTVKNFLKSRRPNLKNELDPDTARYYRRAMVEMTQSLFESVDAQIQLLKLVDPSRVYPGYTPTGMDIYKIFMAIHPFEDGNGRIGRLFYEVMSGKDPLGKRLILPIFDLDLMSDESMEQTRILGLATNRFLSDSKSDADYLRRAQIAMSELLKIHPLWRDIFLELR